MPRNDGDSLWNLLSGTGDLSARALWGAEAGVALADLVRGSSLAGRLGELRGRSVLVATRDQLTAGLALIELDGVASRLVLCPPDIPFEQIPSVIATAGVDALVSDRAGLECVATGVEPFVTCPGISPADSKPSGDRQTEWILLTSGTTGLPKLVVHTLSSLAGAITGGGTQTTPAVWSTFYDIRRYGGLQIFLRALLDGGSLVLSSAEESTSDFLIRAGARGVTHISGTPSHWRRALMSPSAHRMMPRYIRLSGEIVDQSILDGLRAFYPEASVAHAFASTEAGVAFDVGDGLAGFPESLIGNGSADVGPEMKIEDGSLRIRSTRTAASYLGDQCEPLSDGDDFVDTGDMVELRAGRYYFVGRRDGIIKVGGRKVHPEEVEAVINGHSHVRMSLVRSRKNPITGSLVIADVVLKAESDAANGRVAELTHEIVERCREALPPYKVPAAINVVPALAIGATGKLVRPHA